MFTAAGVLLVFVVLFGVFLFFARRILRLAVKLALVGAVVFSLFAGTMFGWWRGWFSTGSNERVPVRQTNNRPTSNTRPNR